MSIAPPSSSATTADALIWLGAAELARRIGAGEVSSLEVVEAHCRRIEAVNGRLNAVVIPLLDQARQEAARVDEARARGEALGPLAGVPMTIKECYHIAGTASTIGIDGFQPASSIREDSILVQRLRSAGAIVLGKTNIPQLMVMHETDNPVYGRTNNPWNVERGSGGSSGGEAAIIAAGGSPLGLGNDLGGSIRQPSHSCGVCGIKPTSRRLTCFDTAHTFRGMEAFSEQAGPMARSVDDLTLALRVLAAPGLERVDPSMAPVPLGDPAAVRLDQLRVAYWEDDGFFRPAPAVRRAVREAAEMLRGQGVAVEPFPIAGTERAITLYFRLLSADGGADLKRLLGGSRRDWRVKKLLLLGVIPPALRPLVGGVLRTAGQRKLGHIIASTGRLSADRYWQTIYELRGWVRQFLTRLEQGKLDAVLCPPHALPALRHGATDYLASAASYCMVGNLLQWPAGVVPVTRVRPDEESDRPASGDLVEKAARETERGSAGLPVGVQVAARHWREDIVLALMKAIELAAKSRADFPARPPL